MGMLYTALWYYPVILAGCGLITLTWDLGLYRWIGDCFRRLVRTQPEDAKIREKIMTELEKGYWTAGSRSSQGLWKPLPPPPAYSVRDTTIYTDSAFRDPRPAPPPPSPSDSISQHKDSPNDFGTMTWKVGTGIILFFFITFITILTVHSSTKQPQRSFSLFSSLYLAGTIIFGGGPVVIPLLREYIVAPGWVTPRDFLLGLAVIQAFPGPNFNFAIYLGSLTVANTPVPSYCGALIAFVAIYAPGLFIVIGFTGLWRLLRHCSWFLAILRGINAGAVGLVFTAVYKLWQIGYLTAEIQSGSPLGTDPWLVAITGTAFVGSAWFRMSPPVAILLGGTMGVARYGVVDR